MDQHHITRDLPGKTRHLTSGLRIINEPKNPNEDGGDFRKAFTSDQWMAIRRLVGYVSGSKIYCYVEAWDELNRKSEIGVMSFIFGD
jgi:hypothetical protein